jgi:hypothetical protein
MADKSKGGRPLKFKSAKELQKKIDEYFESCFEEVWQQNAEGNWEPVLDRHGEILRRQIKPFTITGLALALDTTRETLLDYEEKDEFSDTIKRAKQRCENYAEEQLFKTNAKNITGIIFNLKNNYGRWADKQEVDTNIANKDGKPFETNQNVNLKNLSPKELAQLEQIIAKTADSG